MLFASVWRSSPRLRVWLQHGEPQQFDNMGGMLSSQNTVHSRFPGDYELFVLFVSTKKNNFWEDSAPFFCVFFLCVCFHAHAFITYISFLISWWRHVCFVDLSNSSIVHIHIVKMSWWTCILSLMPQVELLVSQNKYDNKGWSFVILKRMRPCVRTYYRTDQGVETQKQSCCSKFYDTVSYGAHSNFLTESRTWLTRVRTFKYFAE